MSTIETVHDFERLDHETRHKALVHECLHLLHGNGSTLVQAVLADYPDFVLAALRVAMIKKGDGDLGWVKLGQPAGKGHQRFFMWYGPDAEHYGDVAVADLSGPTPDRTEDGTLWIDHNRKVTVDLYNERISISLPVYRDDDDDRVLHTGIVLDDLAWLVKHGHITKGQIQVCNELKKWQQVLVAVAID